MSTNTIPVSFGREDLTDRKFGRLTVIGYHGKNPKYGYHLWFCRCVCGTEKPISKSHLTGGKTVSCGCFGREKFVVARSTRNGMTIRHHREYKTWHAMIDRCVHPKCQLYPRYGGRGITVCGEWTGPEGFQKFFTHVGPCPSPRHTIDRIDNDGNYEPGNVRWATMKEQCRNKSNNTFLEMNGERLIVRDWANRLGINEQTLFERLRRGWSAERTLTTPVRRR